MTSVINNIETPVKRSVGRPRLGTELRTKTWYYNNDPVFKEKYIAYLSTSVDCECGAYVTNSGMTQHRRSVKHQNYIKSKK